MFTWTICFGFIRIAHGEKEKDEDINVSLLFTALTHESDAEYCVCISAKQKRHELSNLKTEKVNKTK